MTISPTPVIPQYYQDPDADLDYSVDWGTWIAAEVGDSILTSTWSTPDGITSHSPSLVGGTKAVIWLRGGTLGVNYDVVNHIVTAQGRDADQTIRVFIQTH